MTHLKRWKNTIQKKPVDRAPLFYLGTAEFNDKLSHSLHMPFEDILHRALDVTYRHTGLEAMDLKAAEPAYIGPEPTTFPDGTFTNIWGVIQKRQAYAKGTYVESIRNPLQDADSVDVIQAYPWPSVDDFDYNGLCHILKRYPQYPFMLGYFAIGWFSWEMRGMQQFLMDLHINPKLANAIVNTIADFGYAYFCRLYDATSDYIGKNFVCIHIADDWAQQDTLTISPEMFRTFFKPHYKRIVEKAHSLGLKVEYHCCGCVLKLIPDLIDIGIDILNPIQVSAKGMDPAHIINEYGRDLCFSGAIDVQHLLPFSTPQQIREEVMRILDVFSRHGGYFCGPTHNIQVNTPVENVVAMYKAIYDYYGYPNTHLS